MTDILNDEPITVPAAALEWLGHNEGPSLYADVAKLESRLKALGDTLTETTAPLMRDVMNDAHSKFGSMEEDRKTAQDPHQKKIDSIRAAFRPLSERAVAVKETARTALNKFLAAEELRLQQEKRDAEMALEEQRRLANAALAEAETSPFAQGGADDAAKVLAELEIDAQHAARKLDNGPSVASASGQARAAGYRTTWSAKVIDASKLVKKFAKHPDVIEAAQKLANASARASKGQVPIPGCEIVETRKAV